MNSKWIKEKDKLQKLIFQNKLSYEKIGKLYNCSGSNIKKVAIRLGLNLVQKRKINSKETFNKGISKVSKSQCKNCGKEINKRNTYCSIKCQKEFQHKQNYQLLINGDPSIMKSNYSPRRFKDDILKEQKGMCAICGITETWNNKPLVFIVDHIDGHASNNKRDNLRCICPNCDSQLDTYKSKNKNSDRKHRYRNK